MSTAADRRKARGQLGAEIESLEREASELLQSLERAPPVEAPNTASPPGAPLERRQEPEPEPPCVTCRFAEKCRVGKLCCQALLMHAMGVSPARVQLAPRAPTHSQWEALRELLEKRAPPEGGAGVGSVGVD